MTRSAEFTTIAAWPLALQQALQQQGIDPAPLFQQADIDTGQLQHNPDGRVSVERMTQLWHLSETATANPAFGLIVGQCSQPLHFRALGLMMMACDTLLQALEKLVNTTL